MLEPEKFLIIFPKIWIEKVVDGLPKENEGKTDNRKTMITFSFNKFSAPSDSRMFTFWLFHRFTTQLYTQASEPWINLNHNVTSFVEQAN